MKTIHQRNASHSFLGTVVLLSLLSSICISFDFHAFSDLCQAIESQWLNIGDWVTSGMSAPHRTQW